jgi:hypothetical protein
MTGEICRSNTFHGLQRCYDSKGCFLQGWLQNSLQKIREGRNIINNLQTSNYIQRKQPSWSSLLRHEVMVGGGEESLSPLIGCLKTPLLLIKNSHVSHDRVMQPTLITVCLMSVAKVKQNSAKLAKTVTSLR